MDAGRQSLPDGLRLAQPGDQKRLFDFCLTAYAENGFGGIDHGEVRRVIEAVVWRDNCVFGIIDGPEKIEAGLGLLATKLWYGGEGDWFWSELLLYVHPQHRRSRHAAKLLQFADWWSRHSAAPVSISLTPADRLVAKERLFSRYGKRVGATFLIGDPTFRYMARAA